MSNHRIRDILRNHDPNERTAPPVVVWRCTKGHLLLRVFVTLGGWLVTRQDFKVPLADYLPRVGSPFTADDVRAGRAVKPITRVSTEDHTLPLDIDTWPSGQFEVGCRCRPQSVDIALLAQHCRQAADTRTPVDETIPVVGTIG